MGGPGYYVRFEIQGTSLAAYRTNTAAFTTANPKEFVQAIIAAAATGNNERAQRISTLIGGNEAGLTEFTISHSRGRLSVGNSAAYFTIPLGDAIPLGKNIAGLFQNDFGYDFIADFQQA